MLKTKPESIHANNPQMPRVICFFIVPSIIGPKPQMAPTIREFIVLII